jgi:hypothetical protein
VVTSYEEDAMSKIIRIFFLRDITNFTVTYLCIVHIVNSHVSTAQLIRNKIVISTPTTQFALSSKNRKVIGGYF